MLAAPPGIPLRPWNEQEQERSGAGRQLLAGYDAETILVYQAYRREIGEWSVAHGTLGGPGFSPRRMSWIKPSFLWMMYRSGWGTKPDQEMILGLRIERGFFDRLVADAVLTDFEPDRYSSRGQWQAALSQSPVRVQWDPDRMPGGGRLERRVIQLGLRGAALAELVNGAIREVSDFTPFVRAAREHRGDDLPVPVEREYQPRLASFPLLPQRGRRLG